MEAGFPEEVAFEPGLERGAGPSPALAGSSHVESWGGVGKPGLCLLEGSGVTVSQHRAGTQVKSEAGSGWIWRAWRWAGPLGSGELGEGFGERKTGGCPREPFVRKRVFIASAVRQPLAKPGRGGEGSDAGSPPGSASCSGRGLEGGPTEKRGVRQEEQRVRRLGGVGNRDPWVRDLAGTSESPGAHSWAPPHSHSQDLGGWGSRRVRFSQLLGGFCRQVGGSRAKPGARAQTVWRGGCRELCLARILNLILEAVGRHGRF